MSYEDKEMRGATLWAKLMVGLCTNEPKDLYELAEYTGLNRSTVRRYVKALRKSHPPLVHIGGWNEDPSGQHSRPAFTFKPGGRDVYRPKRTRQEIVRRYKAKKVKINSVFALGDHLK